MLNLTIKYTLFAFISTICNILAQYFSLKIYNQIYSLYIAMFIGTIIGLIVKYFLDKKYIFYYEVKGHKDNLQKFLIYSFMGIFTTIIFWTFELTFDSLFPFKSAKFLGAIIGLALGYVIKYNLDKKFVFKKIQPTI